MRCMLFNIVTLETVTPYTQIVYQHFISENLLICKLEHNSSGNR